MGLEKEKLGLVVLLFFFFFKETLARKVSMEIVRKFPEFTKASHVQKENSRQVNNRIATIGEFKKEGEGFQILLQRYSSGHTVILF